MHKPMTKNETNRIKGVAMIMIILFHLQSSLFGTGLMMSRGQGLPAWFTQLGNSLMHISWAWIAILPAMFYIGVHVFFILSGYGLTKKFFKMEHFSYREWLKQIWKLYWPYLVAMPVTLLINLGLSYILVLAGRMQEVLPVFSIYQPWQYLYGALITSRWVSSRLALNFVGTWWFVGVLLQFYLLLPVLIWLLRKLKPKMFIISALLVTLGYRLWAAYFTGNSPIGIANTDLILFINFPARFFEFALGMFMAVLPSLRFFKRQTWAGLALIIVGILSSAYVFGLVMNDILIGLGWALVFPSLGVFLGRIKIPARILSFVGDKSYYFYLYQEPALGMILTLFFGKMPL